MTTDTVKVSPREREILGHIAHGDGSAEIAARLYLAETTIKTHTQRLCRKLGARNRTHLVHLAHQRGLLGGEHRA